MFVTDGWLNSPTDPAGRLRVLTFTPYIANLGYRPGRARAAQVDAIYCAGDLRAAPRPDAAAGRHVPAGQRPAQRLRHADQFAEGPRLDKVFENAGACASGS